MKDNEVFAPKYQIDTANTTNTAKLGYSILPAMLMGHVQEQSAGETMRKKKAGVKDVAQLSGVSISTVSYVMNGKRPISEETSARVIAAARTLGYLPADRARAQELGLLKPDDKPRTKVLALSSPIHAYTDFSNYAIFFFAVAQRARQYGYDILLLMHEQGDTEMQRVVEHHMVDGILLLDVLYVDTRAETAKKLGVPVVAIGYPSNTEGVWAVDLDFEGMGRESIDRTFALGHRHVLIIGSIQSAYEDGSNYLLRYRDSAMRHGKDLGMKVTFQALNGYARADINLALDQALQLDPEITAIFWQGSTQGLAVLMDILKTRGLRVPEDISVLAACTVGAGKLPRPVDEMAMDPTAVCTAAVDTMMGILDGKRHDQGHVELLHGSMRVSGSVGKVAK